MARGQTHLFDAFAAADQAPQHAQLDRVTSRIGLAVLEFVNSHRVFHAAELHDHVRVCCGGAPASADRVLRELRKQGRIKYRVVNRAQSLYEVM